MDTLELLIPLDEAAHDACIAELVELGAEGFLQEDEQLLAYLPAARWSADVRDRLAAWLRAHGHLARITARRVPPQDWEARWRDEVPILAVGRFLIKPTWAQTPPEHAHLDVIEIDPKMSFGTGRHETTRLMLRLLQRRAPLAGRALDAGAGSGILTIAALRLGADTALAFDVDPATRRDMEENFARNHVADRAACRIGSIDAVPETGFDLALANIVRPVILDLLPGLADRLNPGGALMASGILLEERDGICAAASTLGLALDDEATEAEWWAGTFVFRNAPGEPLSR